MNSNAKFECSAKNIDAKTFERRQSEVYIQCMKNRGKISKRRDFKTFSLLTRYYPFIMFGD